MTIVLLHAFPLDGRMWDPQRSALGDDVLAARLYGRGNRFDRWAQEILEEVPGELVVVGASMGGYCALELARQAPERLRGLVLAGSRVDADPPDRRELRAATIALIREQGVEALWEEMRPKLLAPDADPAVVDFVRRIALEQRPEDLVAALEAIRDRRDSTEMVAALDCPVLFAGSTADPYVAPSEAPPTAELRTFESGHLMSLERPEEFNAALTEFLARV
jgi:pimeloyl-ACP methyl ester carboxylesterase